VAAISYVQTGRLEHSLLFLATTITGASLLPWLGLGMAEAVYWPLWLLIVGGAMIVSGVWEHLRLVRLMQLSLRQNHGTN
jgi:hypothetical protein